MNNRYVHLRDQRRAQDITDNLTVAARDDDRVFRYSLRKPLWRLAHRQTAAVGRQVGLLKRNHTRHIIQRRETDIEFVRQVILLRAH